MKRIIVTAALPYANGPIHIGHLVEYLQVDFWTRFQKMRGENCLYICADDTHGTPIMIRARQEGITPEQLIARSREEHLRDFSDFEIEFDHYSSTNSEKNRALAEQIFKKMQEGGHIAVRAIRQSYCEHDKMFLPDRFVRGTCPKCGAADQYGDSCDVCSATYSPTEVKQPRCAVCGNPPVTKDSDHIFFQLAHFSEFLKEWVPAHTQKEIANKLNEWLQAGLQDWDISRDAPYFGFEIPGFPGKYFYVWLDAPVGYISATQEWGEKHGLSLEEVWNGPGNEIYHVVGKDIVYFHCLFWPAMLKNAGLRTPEKVFVHGFLTVNGKKMSKSKGTFVMARTYLNSLDPIFYRYYLATKLSANNDDIDLNLEDFVGRVNSELVGKITNMASRSAQMLHKKLDGRLGEIPTDAMALVKGAQDKASVIAGHYQERNFHRALEVVREIAEEGNKYFDERAPWKQIAEDPQGAKQVLTVALNLFRLMAIYLKPILPSYVRKVEQLFAEQPYTWDSPQVVLQNYEIKPFEHLVKRIEMKDVEAMIENSKVGSGLPAEIQ